MPDTKSQLADYFDHVVERVHAEEVLAVHRAADRDSTTAQPDATPPDLVYEQTVRDRRQIEEVTVASLPRRRAIAAGVAAAMLLVVGLVVAGNRTGGDSVIVARGDSPESNIEQPPPVVESGKVDSPASYQWERVPHDDAAFRGVVSPARMYSITVGGPGLVAVGGTPHDYGFDDADALVWTSVDGLGWSRVADDDLVLGGEGYQSMFSVVAGGPGLVAVGREWFDRDPEYPWSAAVWTSVDGLSWSRVPHDEAVFGDAEMTSVSAGGPGLVAVGFERLAGDAPITRAAVWTSVNGFTWSRVEQDEETLGGPGEQVMNDVITGGPGLIAVGYGTGFGARVWTSVDGFSWSSVAEDAGLADGHMISVTTGGPGFVAVGGKGEPGSNRGPAVWTSVDGLTWSRIPDGEAVFSGYELQNVTDTGQGLVIVGGFDDNESDVWTSEDGLTWSSSSAGKPTAQINGVLDVVVGGPGLVAVGDTDREENGFDVFGVAAVWVASLEN